MDYTTLARVKQEMHAEAPTDDAMITTLITAASRAIDRKCTGVTDPDALDYFATATVTGELLPGLVDKRGVIICYPHKPYIDGVSSFEYRERPFDEWTVVDVSRIEMDGLRVTAYPQVTSFSQRRVRVRIGYTGGLGLDVASLPADLVDAATILTIRYYREAEGGLSDAIGIAELASLVYTKAWPVRVLDALQPYVRMVGWRHIA